MTTQTHIGSSVHTMFNKIDAEKKGQISFEQFATSFKNCPDYAVIGDDGLKKLFHTFDTNHDGHLSLQEFVSLFQHESNKHEQQ